MQQIFEFQLKCSLRIEIVKEVVHLLRTSWLLFSLKFYELRTPLFSITALGCMDHVI